MTPGRARRRCEKDEECGGFTYKGFITNDTTQEFNIFFFHLVLNFEDEMETWNWVSYKADRDYIVFQNKIDSEAERYGDGKVLPVAKAKVNSNK